MMNRQDTEEANYYRGHCRRVYLARRKRCPMHGRRTIQYSYGRDCEYCRAMRHAKLENKVMNRQRLAILRQMETTR